MRLLQLTPRFPFPADDGGKIGIANILRQYALQGCEVSIFSLTDEDITHDAIEIANEYADVYIVPHSTANTFPRILKSFMLRYSIYINKHKSNVLWEKLKSILDTNSFDAIHIDHSAMAWLGLRAAEYLNIPCALRMHNVEWMIWQRYADSLPRFSPQRLYISQQAKALRRAEAEIFSRCSVNFAITRPDMEMGLQMAPDAKFIIAGAGVNSEEWLPNSHAQKNPHELVIATTYRWRHNVDAIVWFIENVMPELQEKYVDLKLTLIGKDAPEIFNNYKGLGVEVAGYVDRVQPYLDRATVYIAPLFVGAGIRIKILEAMAMKLPVVASPVAAEGIEARSDEGLLLCHCAEDFIENISKLFENTRIAKQIGAKARKYVKREFSWETNVRKMLDALRNTGA